MLKDWTQSLLYLAQVISYKYKYIYMQRRGFLEELYRIQ
jgi:hypothetical protein